MIIGAKIDQNAKILKLGTQSYAKYPVAVDATLSAENHEFQIFL